MFVPSRVAVPPIPMVVICPYLIFNAATGSDATKLAGALVFTLMNARPSACLVMTSVADMEITPERAKQASRSLPSESSTSVSPEG